MKGFLRFLRTCIALILAFALSYVLYFELGAYISDYIDKKRYPIKFEEQVTAASEKYEIEPARLYAVILTESSFDQDAESHSGAMGLMQILPDTFSWLQSKRGESGLYEPDRISDPDINVEYGTYYLTWLYGLYGDWETAYAAYNAGPGTVSKWLEDDNIAVNGHLVNIPITETASYVNKIGKAYEEYTRIYFGGNENE